MYGIARDRLIGRERCVRVVSSRHPSLWGELWLTAVTDGDVEWGS